MKSPIKIFADFNNTDRMHRVRLTTVGTLEDLRRMGITLESGLQIILDDSEELVASGVVEFSEEENIWVAKINWDEIK
jgi:hypothetical protein